MSSFDNEIYRGPPEAGPTLEHDIRSYGSDVYILKAEKNTLAQDVPPTEEPIRQEAKPVQKKESKIAKAMKLLASCTAAAAIAVNLTVPPAPPPVEPESNLPEWPQYNYIDENLNGYSVNAISQHSNVSQASTGSKTYRVTSKQEDLHLFWNGTYNIDHNPNREAFCLIMYNLNEDWFLDVSFHLYPQTDTWSEYELLSQFTTESGETFYLRTSLTDESESTKERAVDVLSRLSDYIEISEATDDGWGKVLIGKTMISDTNSYWNGISTTPEISTDFCFSRINQKQFADYTEDQFIRSMTINDIDWSFYYSFDDYSLLLWAVPAQEDIALASGLDFIMNDLGLTIDELQSGSNEVQAVLTDYLNLAVDLAADICFSNYHLYRANGNPTIYFPDEMEGSGGSLIPTDPIEPTDPMPTEPGTIYFDYYDAMLEFTIADRSFIILNWRDDVLLRQHYTGEDHVQIDLATTDGQFRVNLIVSLNPNGAEYVAYPLENGTELYTGIFNFWGDPWIYDEDTLFDVNTNLYDYVRIIETTVQEDVNEPTEPDPYDYLPEYVQYIYSPDGVSYSPYARSNRVCQFITDRGEFRMEAQTPDVFLIWESYHYDIKDESGSSFITISNIAESWSMGLWVFDESVDSIYEGFSLTAEDGTELWFYVAFLDDFTGADRRQAIISRLPELVKLTAPTDDGWGKVQMGETMLVDKTRYWNGTAYTVGGDDFWFFEEIIDASTYSGELRPAGSREINGITWNFYTHGEPTGYGMTEGKEFCYTRIVAAPAQENIYLITSATYGLTMSESEFSSQAEYEAYIDANIGSVITTIVSQGLSNYHLYP